MKPPQRIGFEPETYTATFKARALNRTLPIEANDMTNAARKALREVIQDHGSRLNRSEELQISIKKIPKKPWLVRFPLKNGIPKGI